MLLQGTRDIKTRIKKFFKNHAENEAGKLVLGLSFCLFKKRLYEVKASGLHITFNIFR